ncbi:MAG: DUF4826 family protein [Rhizobiaceae bacterium]|nr:DUF4826 family protein [Rhizobiaceae bacterium]
MDDSEINVWVGQQRENVETYLQGHGIDTPNVGEWPAFEVAPYFAIWAVESQRLPGQVGWWAFSGDCPTDYVSEKGHSHPRAALGTLLENWRSYIPHMKANRMPPNVEFGQGAQLSELGQLLEARVGILEEWYLDDEMWEDI